MTVTEVLAELKSLSSESIRKIFMNHGAPQNIFGVKIGDMKTILKKVKKDQALAMQLYDSGNSDAMYLAGLIADGSKMTRKELQGWVEKATWYMLSEYTVAWVASESKFGHELALEWIESPNENIAVAGWSTLAALLSVRPDEEIDKKEVKKFLQRIEKTIHKEKNRVKYVMNTYVICVGGYVPELTKEAMETGKRIGEVNVNMGNTACNVPFSPDYIQKMIDRGNIGKKKKTAKC